MKKFCLCQHVHGQMYYEVEAETLQEAKEIFWDSEDQNEFLMLDDLDVEDSTWSEA